ncbi:MAG: questin oxidase family protein [Acidimicrobiales bacterium]
MTAFTSSPAFTDSLPRWLDRSRTWGIEHGGFRSNHLTHNWIVLSAAGCDDERMQWWQDLYLGRLAIDHARNIDHHPEPAQPVGPDAPQLSDAVWRDHVTNAPEAYPTFLEFFDERITELGVDGALRRYLPPLLPGIAGAALHPVIQTGWGVEAGHAGMISEGLAYMAVAFQPLTEQSISGPLWAPDGIGPIEASLRFLAEADRMELPRLTVEASLTPAYRALGRGAFQHRMGAFQDPALAVGATLDAAGPLGLPDLDESLDDVIDELAALMAAAYLGSSCEFFVIHGVTSLHGVLLLLDYLTPEQQRDAIAHWWRAAMATVVVQALPGLAKTAELLSTWSASETGTPTKFTHDEDWWIDALHRSLVSRDEHVPKGVFCLYRWTKLAAVTARSLSLFREAAEHQLRPNSSHELHANTWMALDPNGRPNQMPT